jgi:hypothetical protein
MTTGRQRLENKVLLSQLYVKNGQRLKNYIFFCLYFDRKTLAEKYRQSSCQQYDKSTAAGK